MMRSVALLTLLLLVPLAMGLLDLNNTDDQELKDLLAHSWYNMLPAAIKNQKA